MDLNDIITKEGPGINGYVTNFAGSGLSGTEIVQLNKLARSVAHPSIICVDVGVAKGSSTAAMAFVAKENNGFVFSVDDYCEYKKHTDQWAQAKCSDIFLNNIAYLGLSENVQLIEEISQQASIRFGDGSVDIVFIDAGHGYDEVVIDIKSWLPKVRKGGIICGHDCQILSKDGCVNIRPWQNVSQKTTGYDQHDFSWHVGVVLAVGDLLPNAQIIPETTIWWAKV